MNPDNMVKFGYGMSLNFHLSFYHINRCDRIEARAIRALMEEHVKINKMTIDQKGDNRGQNRHMMARFSVFVLFCRSGVVI